MEKINILPLFVTTFFRKMPLILLKKHRLALSWLIFLMALGCGDHKLTGMTSCAFRCITEWRLRRLLSAPYCCLRSILLWLIEEVIKELSVPEDRTIYLIGDGSKKEKRSKKNPYVQKGKIKKAGSWFFGIRFCVLMMSWGNLRIPVDFELIYKKGNNRYQTENQLFRKMLERFVPPDWSKRVIVLGDTAYASKENMVYLKEKAALEWKEKGIFWGFVFALAKTNACTDGKKLSDLSNHLTRNQYRKVFVSPLTSRRKLCYWTFSKKVTLRHAGDVTIVLSKKRRNLGPKSVKIIVTNLPHTNAAQMLNIYQRRFMIEVLFRELKSGMGLGKQKLSKSEERITKSIGISILAYLFLLKMQHQDIHEHQPWSIFRLRERFRCRAMKNQFERRYKLMEKNYKNAA